MNQVIGEIEKNAWQEFKELIEKIDQAINKKD